MFEERNVKVIEHYAQNQIGRDFVVGDIHGMYDLLMEGLAEHNFNFNKDRLFSVGDIVDRGPDSLECIYLLGENWFFSVLGNHEDELLKYINQRIKRGDDAPTLSQFKAEQYNSVLGGDWYLQLDTDSLFLLRQIVERLPLAIKVDLENITIGISHAEPFDDWKPRHINYYSAIWGGKHSPLGSTTIINKGVDRSYHGHYIVKEPIQRGTANWIDTGAFIGGRLQIIELKEDV